MKFLKRSMIIFTAFSLFTTTASVSALSISDPSGGVIENSSPKIPVSPVDPDPPGKPGQGQVTIEYKDRDGNKIEDSDIITGYYGSYYHATPKIITDWKLSATFGEISGSISSDSNIVIFYYEPNFYNPVLDDNQLGDPIVEETDQAPSIETDSDFIPNENANAEEEQLLQEEFDKGVELDQLHKTPKYDSYSQSIVSTKYTNISNWASNQTQWGVYYRYGGSLNWSPSGGRVFTVSAGFAGVSISTNIGNYSGRGTGYSAYVPRSKGYWKLWVVKNFRVRKVALYGHPYNSPKGTKKFIQYGYTKTQVGFKLIAKKTR